MSKFASVLAFALVCAGFGSARPALAMTSGTPADGNGHPAVVALLRSADGYWQRPFCSGMMLNGTVVLTASHCIEFAQQLVNAGWQLSVTNDATLAQDASGWLPVNSLTTHVAISQLVKNPAYDPKLLGGYDHDVSAAVIAAPITLDASAYPALPPQGVLDQLNAKNGLKNATFTVLGYGIEQKAKKGNDNIGWSSERRVGTLGFNALDTRFIHESQRLHQGEDGACDGDSGGPSLVDIGGTTFVMGVTSSGDIPCYATNTATRTDTGEALDLLVQVLAQHPDE